MGLNFTANVNYVNNNFHDFQFLATQIYSQIFSLIIGSRLYWAYILYHWFTVTGYILYAYFICIELDILRTNMLLNDMNKMLEHVYKCSGKLAFGHGLAENIFREMINNNTQFVFHTFIYLRCRALFWVRLGE